MNGLDARLAKFKWNGFECCVLIFCKTTVWQSVNSVNPFVPDSDVTENKCPVQILAVKGKTLCAFIFC